MIKTPGFFEKEKNSTILTKDEGYIERVGIDEVLKKVSHWPSLLGINNEKPVVWQKEEDSKPDVVRIVKADAVRSFLSTEARASMAKVLLYAASRTNDYQQGMAYVASFLLFSSTKKQ